MGNNMKAKKRVSLYKKQSVTGWAFLLPATLLIFAMNFYQMLQAFVLSFKTRIEVLRAANKLDDQADMTEVAVQSRDYYGKALKDGSHTAILVYDKDQIVGAGGISYFKVMPTYHNQTGKKAYIMNMYTNPAYRRKGIAYHTLEILVADAKNKGIDAISLEATEMGRPLYEEFGFVGMKDEMELK